MITFTICGEKLETQQNNIPKEQCKAKHNLNKARGWI